ncbi:hypothetical protein CI109_104803 [Kwoniella shandongensis]|uniref:Uncharacterized protein n=1 Tax=Kwoniella shandongensis TaxID=1734106 RepID=A0A5M6BUX3_9TREE|nr:uncharacterized protein CI109_006887 [Kwoniella shandongensis]KAA5524799.1 hypothetical protein CI109_006887 [Kwoniella shandongensis]
MSPSAKRTKTEPSSGVNRKSVQSTSSSARTTTTREQKPKIKQENASASTSPTVRTASGCTSTRTRTRTKLTASQKKSRAKQRANKKKNREKARARLTEFQRRQLAQGLPVTKAKWQLTPKEKAERRKKYKEEHIKRADEIRKTDPTYETKKERGWRQAAENSKLGREKRAAERLERANGRHPVTVEISDEESVFSDDYETSESSYQPSLESSRSDTASEPESDQEVEVIGTPPNPSPIQEVEDRETSPLVGLLLRSPSVINMIAMSEIIEPEAGPSNPRSVYQVHYPIGGDSYENDGYGIWFDQDAEDGLQIWVDPALKDRQSLLAKIQGEGGQISPDHTQPTTQLLILSPGSNYVFDRYCHPEWLSSSDLRRYRKRQRMSKPEETEEEPWQSKVILKDPWVEACVKAGRFLGERDHWGGCRVGGPPRDVMISTDDAQNGDQDGEREVHAGGQDPGSNPQPENDEEREGPDAEPPRDQHPQHTTADDEPMELDETEEPPPAADAFVTVIESVHVPAKELDVIEIPDDDSEAEVSRPASVMYVDSEATDDETWSSNHNEGDRETSTSQSPPSRESDLQLAEPPSKEPTPDPATMFKGLTFWVDPSYTDRLALIRKIKGAGGTLCAEYGEATHVLIYNFKSAEWAPIVESLRKEGVWCLHLQWASKSLAAGHTLAAQEFCVPGGDLNGDKDDRETGNKSFSPLCARGKPYLSADEMAAIFKRRNKLWPEKLGWGSFLAKQYGVYSAKRWGALYHAWQERTGRFAHLVSSSIRPNSDVSNVKMDKCAVSPNEPPTSPSRGGQKSSFSIAQTIAILQTRATLVEAGVSRRRLGEDLNREYPMYSSGTWSNWYHEWETDTGRFASIPKAYRVSSITTKRSREKSQTPVLSDSTPMSLDPTSPSKSIPNPVSKTNRFEVDELDRIFAKEWPRFVEDKVNYTDTGCYLAGVYGVYTHPTWSLYFSDWRKSRGRFAGREEPRLAGTSSSNRSSATAPTATSLAPHSVSGGKMECEPSQIETKQSSTDVTMDTLPMAQPSSDPTRGQSETHMQDGPLDFTRDELWTMARYLVDKGHNVGYLKPETWEDLAKTHPARNATAYASLYRRRIMQVGAYMNKIRDEAKLDDDGEK